MMNRFDADTIYRELGKFIVSFQAIENELFQIAWFVLDPERTNDARPQLAGKGFRQLVDFTEQKVFSYVDTLEPAGRESFKTHFRSLIEKCREIGCERNKLAHSTYLHLESAGELVAIVRADKRGKVKATTPLRVGTDDLNENLFAAKLTKIAELLMSLGIAHRQLIHWYRPVALPT